MIDFYPMLQNKLPGRTVRSRAATSGHQPTIPVTPTRAPVNEHHNPSQPRGPPSMQPAASCQSDVGPFCAEVASKSTPGRPPDPPQPPPGDPQPAPRPPPQPPNPKHQKPPINVMVLRLNINKADSHYIITPAPGLRRFRAFQA